MPTKMSSSYREHERGSIIVGENFTRQVAIHRRLRKKNATILSELRERRKQWTFVPPSNHTIILHRDQGQLPAGLILSVPHEIGCMILHKRLGRIIERDDVIIDAVIDGDIEAAVEAMGLGTTVTAGEQG
jgi:hypothetical protein